MRVVVDLIFESWEEISALTLRKSWRKIVPISTPSPDQSPSEEENAEQEENTEEDFVRDLQEIGVMMDEEEE